MYSSRSSGVVGVQASSRCAGEQAAGYVALGGQDGYAQQLTHTLCPCARDSVLLGHT